MAAWRFHPVWKELLWFLIVRKGNNESETFDDKLKPVLGKKEERKIKDCLCILGLWVKHVKTADDHMQLENNLAPFSNFFPEMIYIYQQWFDARAKIRILSRVWFLKRFFYIFTCLPAFIRFWESAPDLFRGQSIKSASCRFGHA